MKPLSVSEGLYLTGRDIRPVHKSSPVPGIQRDVRGNHIKGVGKIQSIDRLDQVPGHVIHVDAAAARRSAGVRLCHEEKVVHGIKLHISAAEKLLGGAGKRLRKPGLRCEIVKLYADVNRPDRVSRTALVSAHETDQMISPHRWRPPAGHLV